MPELRMLPDWSGVPVVGRTCRPLTVIVHGAVEVPVQVDYTVDGVPFQGYQVTDAQDLAKVMLSKPKLGSLPLPK